MQAGIKNFFSGRNKALKIGYRYINSFNGNLNGGRTSLTKYYWLLSATGAAVGFFAIKSYKNSTKVYALQQRKVKTVTSSFDQVFIHFQLFRMNLQTKQSSWQQEKSDLLSLHRSNSMDRFTVSSKRFQELLILMNVTF